ncbi:MAG TPA: right-handed parallel beta-helix repeat-containing protein [Solirubrobacteraceae bacterium]|nr:right-handed parallel beta-helix repeat-containing protein [Solirubrobacteraceae bacterium]
MRRTFKVLPVCAVVAAFLAAAGSASAMKTVCAKGCAFTGIQAAINAATPGQTITVGPGQYTENLVVNKAVTLTGAGKNTVLYPATSTPVCGGGSLCGGAASNMILVQADNVTLSKLTLEGDNPNLTSGVVRAGKDIDARNGIIENHELGKYTNLTVSKVSVADVYLRGIYASSGGHFVFSHDTVSNVQGEEASIAMFAFEGEGEMDHNKVSDANDAISENWSKGTRFIDNVVTKSGSGVHTDNNGGSGGAADTIEGNKISSCNTNGYGIFVFVPYLSASVHANKVSGCYIGIAAFGGAVGGQGPQLSSNKIDGSGAATTDPAGSYGVYLTTDQLGFEFGELTASLTGNSIKNAGTGLLVTQSEPTPGQPAGGQATVTASGNSIKGNGTGANGEPGTVVEAKNNWWGCAQGPNNSPRCDTAVGTVSYTPWLTSKP